MRAAIAAIGIALALASCTSMTYTPPSPKPALTNEIVVNRSYDATWDALVAHASGTFFAIDNFERSTGLMTLSYGSSNPSKFVDCGTIKVSSQNFNGSYTDYVTAYRNGSLNGRMNLLVQHVNEFQTRVRVTARYVLDVPASNAIVRGFFGPQNQFIRGGTFAFDSNGSSTIEVYNPYSEKFEPRTCRATGVAENEIIRAVAE